MDGSLLFLQERAEWQEERSRLRLVAQRNVFPQIAWHLGASTETAGSFNPLSAGVHDVLQI